MLKKTSKICLVLPEFWQKAVLGWKIEGHGKITFS